jgi:hypothetical protein
MLPMTRDRAETIGLNGLAFLAAMPDPFGRFLAISGLEAGTLRTRASDPDFLRGVLDFLLTDDGLLGDFCTEYGLHTRDIHTAQRRLGEPC